MVVLFGGRVFYGIFWLVASNTGTGWRLVFSRISPFFSEQANSLVFCFTYLDDRRLNRVFLKLYPWRLEVKSRKLEIIDLIEDAILDWTFGHGSGSKWNYYLLNCGNLENTLWTFNYWIKRILELLFNRSRESRNYCLTDCNTLELLFNRIKRILQS